jgi:hypothetical protein
VRPPRRGILDKRCHYKIPRAGTTTSVYKARPTSPLGEMPRTEIPISTDADQDQTNEESYLRRQSFWQMVTAWATIGAFAAAVIYACFAEQQVAQMTASVDQEVLINRPVIIGHGIIGVTSCSNNVPCAVRVPFMHFGRSTSPEAVAVGHIFVRDAAEASPVDRECKQGGPWPTKPEVTSIATSTASNENVQTDCSKLTNCASWNWTPEIEKDVATFRSGKKVLYLAGCVYYKGLDDHPWFTDYCVQWVGGQRFLNCPHRNYLH